MVELRANPDYFGEQPSIPRVVLQFGGKPLTELLSGNVDLATDITPLEAVQLAADPRFRIYHKAGWAQAIAIAWNHRNPLFQDAAVRKALTLAINRRELHRLLNYPDDLPIFDVPVLPRHFVEGEVPEPLPFDPERAARLLTSSGWVDSDNDGIREKDGQEFRFTLSVSPETSASAVYIQELFKQVGVDMEISSQDPFALRDWVHDQVFEATIFRYIYIGQFDDFWLTGYVNPEASRLRDAAWFTIDKDEVDLSMEQLWKIFAEDVPVTYLYPNLSYSAAHRRVKGLKNGQDILSTIEHLWIEDEE
jgi:ABC-type transport system substrate-binding protein